MTPDFLILALLSPLSIAGCATAKRGNVVCVVSTVVGLEVPTSVENNFPHIRLGLIRNETEMVPVGSNAIPPVASTTDVDIRGLTAGTVHRQFETGEK